LRRAGGESEVEHQLRQRGCVAAQETAVAAIGGRNGTGAIGQRGGRVERLPLPFSGTGAPAGVPLMLKCTVPVGVPAAAVVADTVAVQVTDCVATDGLTEEIRTVCVGVVRIFSVTASVV